MNDDFKPVKVYDLIEYCNGTDDEADVLIYFNNVPIGFMPDGISYDFDGSIRLHITDPLINIKEEPKDGEL